MNLEVEFLIAGSEILRRSLFEPTRIGIRRFRSLFGCSPIHCSTIWKLIDINHPVGAKFEHLLFALLFLKVYATEHVNHTLSGVNEKLLESGVGFISILWRFCEW